MTQPQPADPGQEAPATSADPTVKVTRPPVPGRAVRAEVAAGDLATPPIREDQPTVTITGQSAKPPHRTLEFGMPPAVNVTVGPRPKVRRRHRTWPWIVAVVVGLVVLGVVLLVMMLRGATIPSDAGFGGSAPLPAPGTIGWSGLSGLTGPAAAPAR